MCQDLPCLYIQYGFELRKETLNLVENQYLNVLTGLILLAEVALVKLMDCTQLLRGRKVIPVIFARKELRMPSTIILKTP